MFGLLPFQSTVLYVRVLTCKSLKKLSDVLSRPIFTSSTQVHWFVNIDVSVCLCTSLPKHAGSSQVSRHHTIHALVVPGGASGLSPAQPALQKQPFPPQGYTKTGHSSITITLIKRETKAQHSHKQQTTLERVKGSLNQNFSDMLKLVVQDFISKNKLVRKTLMGASFYKALNVDKYQTTKYKIIRKYWEIQSLGSNYSEITFRNYQSKNRHFSVKHVLP